MRPHKAKRTKDSAREETERLMEFAFSAPDSRTAKDSVKLARTICQKFRMRLDARWRRTYCRACFVPFKAGKTLKVRVGNGRMAYHCLLCGHISRYPYSAEKNARK